MSHILSRLSIVNGLSLLAAFGFGVYSWARGGLHDREQIGYLWHLYVGLFAVTAGAGLADLLAGFRAAQDDYAAILAEALADRAEGRVEGLGVLGRIGLRAVGVVRVARVHVAVPRKPLAGGGGRGDAQQRDGRGEQRHDMPAALASSWACRCASLTASSRAVLSAASLSSTSNWMLLMLLAPAPMAESSRSPRPSSARRNARAAGRGPAPLVRHSAQAQIGACKNCRTASAGDVASIGNSTPTSQLWRAAVTACSGPIRAVSLPNASSSSGSGRPGVHVHAFVHVLSLAEGWAFCLDLPLPFGVCPSEAHALAVSPDGRRLYVADLASGSVAAADTSRLQVIRTADIGLADGATTGAAAHADVVH